MDYDMSVCNKLLTDLKINGVDSSAAVVFFGTQVRCMMALKPNYGPHRKVPRISRFMFPTWILKGYYPGTATVFRITLIHDVEHKCSDANYYAKVTMPPIALNKKTPKSMRYNSDVIDTYVTGAAEQSIFGGEPPPLVQVNKLNIPKCIAPRGMTIFKLKRNKD